MVMRVRVSAAIVLLLIAATAQAQVHFTGQTTADVTLIKDVLGNIQLYGEATLKCATLESVTSEILPKSYQRPMPAPEGSNPARYERWTVTMCSTSTDFLVTFWRPPGDDGTAFGVEAFRPPK
jgi:hypothetical protein